MECERDGERSKRNVRRLQLTMNRREENVYTLTHVCPSWLPALQFFPLGFFKVFFLCNSEKKLVRYQLEVTFYCNSAKSWIFVLITFLKHSREERETVKKESGGGRYCQCGSETELCCSECSLAVLIVLVVKVGWW